MSFDEERERRAKIGRKLGRLLFAAGLALWAVPVPAQDAGQRPGAAMRGNMGDQVLVQKHHLLKRMLDALELKAATRGAIDLAEVSAARELLTEAQSASAQGRAALAEQLTGEAFAAVTRLSRVAGRQGPSPEELRSRYEELRMTVTRFRAALLDAVRDKESNSPELLFADLDSLLQEAVQHADAGDLGRANRVLAAAYQNVTANLATLRANETVVQRLTFSSPLDEYVYEQNRYFSHELLVRLLLDNRDLSVGAAQRVNEGIKTAARLHGEARAHADRGEHRDAIRVEEAAVDHLADVLRVLGVYVPK